MDAFVQIKEIYLDNFEKHPFHMIERVFRDVTKLFAGEMNGYYKCDTRYHDIRHTLETVIVMAQIMDGYNKSGNLPIISQKFFELGIFAALFHDAGYIKKIGDDTGTGAKYTFRHVKRSVEFAEQYLSVLGYNNNLSSVQNMIYCTLSRTNLSNVKFSSKEEEIVGFSLGTADLLAQMSMPNYLGKLPFLFDEFMEAYEYEGVDRLRQKGCKTFDSLEELIKSTPHFYESWVINRFKDMGSVYKYIIFHYNDGRNYYIESIEKNLEKIRIREKNNEGV